jgi:hypothetical protein
MSSAGHRLQLLPAAIQKGFDTNTGRVCPVPALILEMDFSSVNKIEFVFCSRIG